MTDIENLVCKNCGESDWEKVWEEEKGKKGTVKEVFVCKNCDHQGRRLTDGETGKVRLTGEFRGN